MVVEGADGSGVATDANMECAERFLEAVSSKVDARFRPKFVMPGEDVSHLISGSEDAPLKLGQGLFTQQQQQQQRVVASVPGQLNYRIPSSYWVDHGRRKYIPKVADQVVGVVDERGGDFYIVNIFSGTNCILNRLAFEGATKRNRPELKKGDAIYARVIAAGSDCDTELTCVSSSGVKKDWSTGETIYGSLPEGLLIRVSLTMARSLLRPDCAVLNALGKHLVFEVAVGMNGAVWLRSTGGALETTLIRNAILNAEGLTDVQAEVMVEQLVAMAAKMSRKR